MRATENDTEITLGTGRMLALFFMIVLVCAVFFAIGFSLGRKSSLVGINSFASSSAGPTSPVVRPSAGKDAGSKAAPSAGSTVPADSGKAGSAAAQQPAADQSTSAPNHPSAPAGGTPSATGGYFVQVAAVTREEDADALVEALKKKQYSAFAAKSSPTDKFYHVQVGPYADSKDAEAMRKRLVADGYNPILKKL